MYISGFKVTIPEDKVNQVSKDVAKKLNCALTELRHCILVENVIDSAKFGVSVYLLTYVGSWFNAMTLIILAWVGLFSIPKVSFNCSSKAQSAE